MPSFDALSPDVRRTILGISHGRPAEEHIARMAGSEGAYLLIGRGKKVYRLKLHRFGLGRPTEVLQIRARVSNGRVVWRAVQGHRLCQHHVARYVANMTLVTRPTTVFIDVVSNGVVTHRECGIYEKSKHWKFEDRLRHVLEARGYNAGMGYSFLAALADYIE